MLDLTYPQKVHLEKWDIDVKPYLTIESMALIIDDLIMCENGLERDMKLIAGILVACTDLYDGEEDADYTYEDLVYSGFWYDLLNACPILRSNIETIYREVEDYLGLNRSIIRLIDSLTNVVESVDVSKFDLTNIDTEQINDIVKKISDKIGE